MAAKFFVYDGAQWRSVSLESGAVAGWGRVQFAAARGGRLALARRGAVLRGLRALAAGAPSSVRDGLPLPQIRCDVDKVKALEASCEHCGGCGRRARPLPALRALPAPPPTNDEIFRRLLKADAGTQCGAVEAGAQTDALPDAARSPRTPTPRRPQRPVDSRNSPGTSLKRKRSESLARPLLERDKRGRYLKGRKRSEGPPKSRWRDTAEAEAEEEEEEQEVACKELVVQEEDVAALRRFAAAHAGRPFRVDLARFDADDDYKRRVFYKLNPVVDIERSARVERLLRERRSSTRVAVGLREFVSQLGLRRVPASAPDSASAPAVARSPEVFTDDTDKENAARHVPRPPVKRTKVLKDNDSDRAVNVNSGREKDKKIDSVMAIVPNKVKAGTSEVKVNGVLGSNRGKKTEDKPEKKVSSPSKKGPTTYVSKSREYSVLEDEAIVSWVWGGGGGEGGEGGRARRVKGNRLWRELQPLHQRRTGHFRTWQSLRNRYLRHLLPRLAALVPPAAAAALRAAAARGELKSRKYPERRNSAFTEPPVRSAWARRPRPHRPPRSPRTHSSSRSPSARPARAPSPSLPPARAPAPTASSSSHSSPTPARTVSSSSHSSRPPARTVSSSSHSSPPPARTVSSSSHSSPPPAHARRRVSSSPSASPPPRRRSPGRAPRISRLKSSTVTSERSWTAPSDSDYSDDERQTKRRGTRKRDEDDGTQTKVKRTLRSSGGAAVHTRTPTYSDITRRYATRFSSSEAPPPPAVTTSTPSNASPRAPRRPAPPRPPPARSATPPRPPRVSRPSPPRRASPPHSIRPLRFSRPPAPPPPRPPPPALPPRTPPPAPPTSPRAKRRRLYNPGQIL